MPKPPPWPSCARASIPIVYGLPGFEVFGAADRGEVRLGGCTVDGGEPQWACPACEVEFAYGGFDTRLRRYSTSVSR